MTRFFTPLGEFAFFAAHVLGSVFSRRWRFASLVRETQRVGVESLTVVNLCAFAIGVVLVLQSASLLARFGAKAQVATLMSAAFVREIGPVFTAIMFSGRVGTGIAAELSSMVVTEQVDAYRAFGTDPIARLATPRVLATLFMLPALTAIADVVGIFSGYMMGVLELGVPADLYLRNSLRALEPLDVWASLAKGAAFGLAIGLLATFLGLRARRATEAVGESATKTMVACVLAVLGLDVFLTKIFLYFGP